MRGTYSFVNKTFVNKIKGTRKMYCLSDYECRKLLKIASYEGTDLCRAIKLALYEGKKLKEITDELSINRRTLQGRLMRTSLVLGRRVTFEILRFTCAIKMFNKGYTPEYVSSFMNYSRHDTCLYRRKLAGVISPRIRLRVFNRDNFKCVFCNRSDLQLQVDHLIPVSKGGLTKMDNLQTLCMVCNSGKSNKDFKKQPDMEVSQGI